MAPINRIAWHDMYLWDSGNRSKCVASLYAAPGTTNGNLYFMLGIVCCFGGAEFELRDTNEKLVEPNRFQLQNGNYYVCTEGKAYLS